MGSPASSAASPSFRAAFAAEAEDGAMPFERFMKLALYHPEAGYYRSQAPRVGRGPGTDFQTAASAGPVFGELVAAACAALLEARDPAAHAFVEIGAEPGTAGVLADVLHPFASARTVSIGESLALAGPCVVFSNELFDAQPCRRFVFRAAGWRELGVEMREDGSLAEVDLEMRGPEPWLPAAAAAGAIIDAPVAAAGLMERIAAQPWHGLLVACDYGKSWAELAGETPAGTLRAYHRHRQSNELLARPGEQDLTCHVCWDWLAEVLQRHGFNQPSVESQESFFVRHAGARLEAITAETAGRFSPRKQALLQLLHPGNMGQKFQVLHGLRRGLENTLA